MLNSCSFFCFRMVADITLFRIFAPKDCKDDFS